jgi:hypothetical protein
MRDPRVFSYCLIAIMVLVALLGWDIDGAGIEWIYFLGVIALGAARPKYP